MGDLQRGLRLICPLKQLVTVLQLTQNEMFFPSSEISSAVLTENMKVLVCIEKNIKPHSLRIGGHTYYTVYGPDTDF